MALTTLPLHSLILSKLNVRHTERDADITALADDIAARGLKQNLVVIPAHFLTGEAEDGWDNKWEVIAGGRRFQAMQLLVADGRLQADHEVPCLLEDRDEASETSLSENLHKVAMNPADEFGAFKTIVDQRMSPKHGESEATAIAYTAKRFGKTVSYVEGRMRLADLCPEVLEALRNDQIGLEAAKAYAATTDHALQLKVFKEREKDTWNGHKPSTIRDAIRNRTLPLDHALVEFVGLVTYQAAGGRIEGEMFMGSEGQQRVVDVTLLEKLAKQVAEAAIPALAKTDGFKEGLYAPGVGWSAKWPKAPKGMVKHWGYASDLGKTKRKQAVGVYALNKDPEGEGHKLTLVGLYKPEAKQEPRQERDWKAEQKADARLRAIKSKAARMALPKVAHTPFEGITFYPTWGRLVEECDEDHSYVTVWIKVANADIDANIQEATRLVDEELAAEEREKLIAELKAEREAKTAHAQPKDDGTDELVTDEAEG